MSSTSATVRVEKATSDLLIGPDWTLNMDICDLINSDYGQAKDVVKAVKKRLQHKNPRVQFLALTLLETMIKNCGEFVHFQVADRGILQEMIKIVRKKTDMQVREKILVLLDSWQEAFGGPGAKHPQYYWAYTELKRSGVSFPQRSPDSALIFTGPVIHPAAPPPRHLQIGYGMPSNSSVRLDEAMASEMANLSSSDLDRYRSVMELLSDMLKAVNPGDCEAVRDEVIADLVGQCRSNQKKLMQFVNSTEDEELLAQGLALNDDLQSLLAKHDAIASGSPLPAEPSESVLETTTPVAAPMPAIPNRSEVEEEEDDDDDFAQLARRNSKYKQAMASSNPGDQTNAAIGNTSELSSSSVGCNALALPDPPAPIKTSADKEQDMIDLLSLTLSSSSPPRTPLTPPSSISPNGPTSHLNPQPQPYLANQGYAPYNSYVAPWAQPQPQPQPQPWGQPQPQQTWGQPQPQQPWAQPQPQQPWAPSQPQPQHQVPQIPSSYPPPPWAATSSANLNPFMTNYKPMQATRPQQQYNSFDPRAYNSPANNAQVNPNLRQPGYGVSPRPYVHSDKLFDDLLDLRVATDKSDRPNNTSPSMSGSSGQSPNGGRK